MLNCPIKAVDVQFIPGGVIILISAVGSGVGCWFTCGFSEKNDDIVSR